MFERKQYEFLFMRPCQLASLKSGLWVFLFMTLLFSGFQASAQREADSLYFKSLSDSMKALRRQGKFKETQRLGDQLLAEATEKSYYIFMIEAYLQKSRALDPMSKVADGRTLLKKALEIAEQHDIYASQNIVFNNLGFSYYRDSHYDSAIYYYQKGVDLAREFLNKDLASNLSMLAWMYGNVDNRELELEAYLASLKALEENPESNRKTIAKSMTLGGLGDYYSFTKNYAEAYDYYQEKLSLGKETGIPSITLGAHLGLGNLLRSEGYYDFEKSKMHYEAIIEIEDPAFAQAKNMAVRGLAKLHRREGNLDQSTRYFRQTYDYYDARDVIDMKAEAAISLGEVSLEQGRLNEANDWLTRAYTASTEQNLKARERDALKSLYKVDSLRGRYRAALGHFQKMHHINDSLAGERSRNRIKELEIQYETEQTEKENLALKSDLELKEAQVARQQIVQAFVAVVAVTFIVLALVVYRNYQRKKRDNEIISLQANELKTLSRFKDGLTSMVVHDMRNPLNAILGFSQGTPTDDKLKNINRSGHQVLNLVNNMLDIQRFEEAKVEMNPELINARQLVAETIQEVSLIAASKSLKVTNRIPETLEYRIDPVLINRVLVNLLINSVKYSKSGGEIFVEVGAHENAHQELIVRDQGHGIPSDQLPYIFNKFWHNDPGRSGILPSTGLGLSFSKLAVEAHGGSIRAESVLHEGTSIFLFLPLAHEGVEQNGEIETEQVPELIIAPEDVEVYHKYLPQLEQLEVFEISEINKLIKAMESHVTDSRVGGQLRTAAFQGDQVQYESILAQIKKEAVI